MAVKRDFLKIKVVRIGIIIIGLVLIINLCRDIHRLLKASQRIKLVEKETAEIEKETGELRQKKEYYQSEDFIEEQARNKLNMARPGETIVILPPNIEKLVGSQKETSAPEIPNWRKWWNLFFK